MAKDKKKSKKDKKEKKSKKSKKSSGAPATAAESSPSQSQSRGGTSTAGSLFDAGQLFERYARTPGVPAGHNHVNLLADGAVVARKDFLKLMQELTGGRGGEAIGSGNGGSGGGGGGGGGGVAELPSPTTAVGATPSPRTQFDAGRIFERFDRAKRGLIDRATFLQIMGELRVGETGGMAAGGALSSRLPGFQNPELRSAASKGETEGKKSPAGPSGRSGALIAVHPHLVSNLLHKKEQLVFQARCVQTRMEQVRAWKRSIERETLSDVEAVLQRLGSEEAFKLSLLQHDVGALRRDIDEIESFVQDISGANPLKALDRPGLGSMRAARGHSGRPGLASAPPALPPPAAARTGNGDAGSHHDIGSLRSEVGGSHGGIGQVSSSPKARESPMDPLELVRLYPELCSMAERLSAKPFKKDIDVMHDDYPREMLDRLERANAYDELLDELKAKESQIEEGEREIASLRQARSQMVEKVEHFTADVSRHISQKGINPRNTSC